MRSHLILNRMVKYYQPLDTVFLALADPTRRSILQTLSARESTVSELARPYNISLPAVMKHISVLQRAGLVSHHKIGRTRHCRLVARPMMLVADWLATYHLFWEKQLDSLDRFLTEPQPSQEQIPCRQPQRRQP